MKQIICKQITLLSVTADVTDECDVVPTWMKHGINRGDRHTQQYVEIK